jgi:hypothetical protein
MKVDWQLINTTNIIILSMAVLAVLILGPGVEMLLAFVAGVICGIYMGIIAVEEAEHNKNPMEKEKHD